jgi:phosphatidylserine/phosphatidylglycerophosphate/cardiolipin synthase-like enzyme
MIRATTFLGLTFLLASAAWSSPEVCFTPGSDCTGVIVREIGTAKKSVRVQAYSFTSAPIAKALVDASKRGVKVEVILDRSNRTERYSGLTFLLHANIPTSIDAKHAIAHNKIIIIDDETVITGSFNFTKAAQAHNAENLLVIRDPVLAAKYVANWRLHLAHSDDTTP